MPHRARRGGRLLPLRDAMEAPDHLVTVLTLIFFGMRYLHRNPLAFIILPAFLRGGLLGARR